MAPQPRDKVLFSPISEAVAAETSTNTTTATARTMPKTVLKVEPVDGTVSIVSQPPLATLTHAHPRSQQKKQNLHC